MNPFAQSVFSMTAACLPCCATAVEGCACEFKLPMFDTEATPGALYVDADAAEAGLAALASCYVVGWEGLAFDSQTGLGSLTSAWDAGANELTFSGETVGSDTFLWFAGSISIPDSINVSFAWTLGGDASGVSITIFRCDDVFGGPSSVFTYTGSSPGVWSPGVIPDPPSTFLYLIQVYPATGTGTLSANFTISGDLPMVANPVNSYYDTGDPDAPQLLGACPKLLLPPLTESTGTWYEDCAAADAVLTDADQVSNCVGFCEGGPGLTAFTATDGGTSLTLAVTGVAGAAAWGGINAEDGETITVTGTVSTGTVSLAVDIYDDTGTLVESSGSSVSSPWTSAALPYTGRYSVRAVVQSTVISDDTSGVTTSSGTMSVNEIQALWDNGLTCPSRLDCGDSC